LFNDLAITYIHIGDYEKSIEMSMRALEICSGDYESAAYFNLGLAYENIGDINNALKNYISAMRLGNNTAKSRVLKIMPGMRLFGVR
jgi:tetratricopeptide (TPR) repeat protein